MKKLCLMLSILTLVSCGKKDGGKSSSNPSISSPDSTPLIGSEYLGIWARCVNYSSDNTSEFYIYSVSSNSVVLNKLYYDNLNCEPADIAFDKIMVFDISKNGSQYFNTTVGASIKSRSASDLAFNNSNSYCGISDWVLDEPRDILSRDCLGITYNSGDTESFSVSINSGNLILTTEADTLELEPLVRPTFGQSSTIENGSYVFYMEKIALYYTFSNGSYDAYAYDSEQKKYQRETGTYTTNAGVIEFTVSSSNPGCASVGSTYSLEYSAVELSVIFRNENKAVFTGIFTPLSEAHFRNSFIGSGYSLACF